MRQGHNNNNNNNSNKQRMRGRSRKGPNPLQRSFESNGPDVKIRGTAMHIAEKYVMLARDAASSGDRVAEQSYLQHAEHYYRIVAAAQAQIPQALPFQRPEEFEDEDDLDGSYDRAPQQQGDSRASFGVGDPQPYVTPFNGQQDGGEGEGDFDSGQNDQQQQRRPQQNEPRQNNYNNRPRDNYRQQGEYRGQGGQGGQGGGQGGQGEPRQQGEYRQHREPRQQGEPRAQGEQRPQGEYRQQEFRQNDFRQQQQPAQPQPHGEVVVQAEGRPPVEARPEGELAVQPEGGFPAGAEQPRFRSRGRRSGRGRPRPEGGEFAPAVDAAGGAPQTAPVQESAPAPATVSED